MHCGFCGDLNAEVRPCFIHRQEELPLAGDCFLCKVCAQRLAIESKANSVFATWIGISCDRCGRVSAFDGDIDGLPTGIVCDQCGPPDLDSDTAKGVWLCEDCFETAHAGHRQRQLQPILDRLAKILERD